MINGAGGRRVDSVSVGLYPEPRCPEERGHRVARSTIARILKEQGISPVLRVAVLVGYVSADALGRDCWRGFLHDRGGRGAALGDRTSRHAECRSSAVRRIRTTLSCGRSAASTPQPASAPSSIAVIVEFVEHDHRERHHQGLGNELINRRSSPRSDGGTCRRPHLGGLLNYDYRAA